MKLLREIATDLPGELVEVLVRSPHCRVERIVSQGHASRPGFWYDQAENEWVAVLKGRAGIALADQPGIVVLEPGDAVHIPARVRHRVEWTDPDGDTVWLAVFY